jgi:hypothetical protein
MSDFIYSTPFTEGTCVGNPCWYAVPNATGKEIVVLDLYPNTTSNIVVKGMSKIKLSDGGKPAALCDPNAVSNDVGFVCKNGPYIPTKAGA